MKTQTKVASAQLQSMQQSIVPINSIEWIEPSIKAQPMRQLVCGLIVTLFASSLYADGIQWRKSFLDALNESERTKQHMFVQITADWCNYCKKMDSSTLADPAIVKLINSSFIPVKVDADLQKTLTKRIKVQYVPSSVVISADRKILAKLAGYQSVAKLKGSLPRFARPITQPIAEARPKVIEQPIQKPKVIPEPEPIQKPVVRKPVTKPSSAPALAATSQNDKPAPQDRVARTEALPLPPTPSPNPTRPIPNSTSDNSAAIPAKSITTETAESAQPTPKAVRQTAGQSKPKLTRPEYSFDRVCLCSLLDEQTMVMGSKQHSYEYKGAKLCFASPEHLRRFIENPKRYWPAWGGACALSLRIDGKLVEGSPRFGAVFQDRLWFFTTQEHKDEFTIEPRSYLPPQSR